MEIQNTDKTLFLGMSFRVCPEEISIWISKQQSHPTDTNPLRSQIEERGELKVNVLSVPATAVIFSAVSALLVLGLSAQVQGTHHSPHHSWVLTGCGIRFNQTIDFPDLYHGLYTVDNGGSTMTTIFMVHRNTHTHKFCTLTSNLQESLCGG